MLEKVPALSSSLLVFIATAVLVISVGCGRIAAAQSELAHR